MTHHWLTISQWARREGVARNTVLVWMQDGRVDWWEPAVGVRMIKAESQRPTPWGPWHRTRQERISHEEV